MRKRTSKAQLAAVASRCHGAAVADEKGAWSLIAMLSAFNRHQAEAKTPAAPSLKFPFLILFTRRERWGLSCQGWVLSVILLLLAAWGFTLNICPFLSVTQRVTSDVLVVEGWLPEHLVQAAADEFDSGGYVQLFTTGGGWSGITRPADDAHTWARVGADRLRAAGIPAAAVRAVPSYITERDRTYASAVALREWLGAHNVHIQRMNVVTEGLHARRTRLLFQKAFGKNVSVGVIGLNSPNDDFKHWWHYSETIREVIGETLGYMYATVFSIAQTSCWCSPWFSAFQMRHCTMNTGLRHRATAIP